MDLGFIRRSIGATLGITGLVFLVLLAYGKTDWGWAVGLGSLWSCANWVLITGVMHLVLTRERRLTRRSKLHLALLGLVKFPLLYGAGYVLLRAGFPPLALLSGFWIVFVVVIVKTLGRMMMGLDRFVFRNRVEGREGETA